MPLSDKEILEVAGIDLAYRKDMKHSMPALRAIARAAEEAEKERIVKWLEKRWVSYTENQIDGSKRMCFSMSEEEWPTLREGGEVPPHVDHALAREVEGE